MQTAIHSLLLGTMLSAAVPAIANDNRTTEAGDHAATPVVVVVKVAKPWYAPRFLVVRKMREALPQYQRVPGLMFKIFTLARPGHEFGGIYLWRDRASAQAWFSPAWYKRVREQRHAEADVRMFDATALFDHTQGIDVKAWKHAVATAISVSQLAGATRETGRTLSDAMAIAHDAPGLLREYRIEMPDGAFGRVYLWRDEAAARRALDAEWQAKLRGRYGSDPKLEWFDAPILMPSGLPENREDDRRMRTISAGATM